MSKLAEAARALLDSWDPDAPGYWPEMAALRAALEEHAASAKQVARPADEWHEDHGDVLWWRFPIEEAPYVGSPLDTNWPGYHTHWTPLVTCGLPIAPGDGEPQEAESAARRFEVLTARQQDQARARFFNARPGDGYLYELLSDGSVLCRRRDGERDKDGYELVEPAAEREGLTAELAAVTAERAALQSDARRWREVARRMTHQHRGDAVGWTLDELLPGDDPDAAADAAIAASKGKP